MVASYIPVSPGAYKLFHEGTTALAAMERNGCRVDVEYLRKTVSDVQRDIDGIETQIRQEPEYKTLTRLYGTTANLNSGPQLAKVLYKEHKHHITTADGEVLTNVDEYALSKVGTPFANLLLSKRKLDKLGGTYLKPILDEQHDGFLHACFNLNMAITYRSSCSDPNLQNIPVRNKAIAKLIRRAFIPRDGHVIAEFDLKGAEVCVSACYHHDPNLVQYLKDPTSDMHRDVAKKCFFIEDVPKPVRQVVKGDFVFAAFYGDWYRSICQGLWEDMQGEHLKTAGGVLLEDHLRANGIHSLGACKGKTTSPGTFEHHIKGVADNFWENMFAVYNQWKKDWWNLYLENGGFQTLTGFRVEGVLNFNDVVNYPIQGSSFHCLLWALVELQKWCEKHKLRTKLISTIHDSIIADVYLPELDYVVEYAQWLLTTALPAAWPWLCVPLTAEVEVAAPGLSWFDKAAYHGGGFK